MKIFGLLYHTYLYKNKLNFSKVDLLHFQNLADFDDFPDDMEDLMEEMDAQDFQSPPAQTQNSNRAVNDTKTENLSVNNSLNKNSQVKQCAIKPSSSQIICGMVERNAHDSSSQEAPKLPKTNDNGHTDDLDAMDFADDMDFPHMDDDFMTSTNTQTNAGIAMKDTTDDESDKPDISKTMSVNKDNRKTKLSMTKVKTEATDKSLAANSFSPSMQVHKVQQKTLKNYLTPNKPLEQRQADIADNKRGTKVQSF